MGNDRRRDQARHLRSPGKQTRLSGCVFLPIAGCRKLHVDRHADEICAQELRESRASSGVFDGQESSNLSRADNGRSHRSFVLGAAFLLEFVRGIRRSRAFSRLTWLVRRDGLLGSAAHAGDWGAHRSWRSSGGCFPSRNRTWRASDPNWSDHWFRRGLFFEQGALQQPGGRFPARSAKFCDCAGDAFPGRTNRLLSAGADRGAFGPGGSSSLRIARPCKRFGMMFVTARAFYLNSLRLFACYLPARSALRLNPVEALGYE